MTREKIGEGEGKFSGESFPSPSPNPTLSSSKTFVFIESLFRVFNMLKEEALSCHMVALSQQYAEKYVLFLRFFAAWLNDWGILSDRVVNYI